MLARCQRGDAKHVIVWKLDRLTRRTRDLLSLVEEVFLAKQVELHWGSGLLSLLYVTVQAGHTRT